MTFYDDDYATCAKTYATLTIYKANLDPLAVESGLALSELGAPAVAVKTDSWSFTSKDALTSKDVRRHIDWVLDKLPNAYESVKTLRGDGYEVDFRVYWLSASGHGGPTLSPAQMRRLADADLDVIFDVYCDDKQEDAN